MLYFAPPCHSSAFISPPGAQDPAPVIRRIRGAFPAGRPDPVVAAPAAGHGRLAPEVLAEAGPQP
jgi:hypothetical protein